MANMCSRWIPSGSEFAVVRLFSLACSRQSVSLSTAEHRYVKEASDVRGEASPSWQTARAELGAGGVPDRGRAYPSDGPDSVILTRAVERVFELRQGIDVSPVCQVCHPVRDAERADPRRSHRPDSPPSTSSTSPPDPTYPLSAQTPVAFIS